MAFDDPHFRLRIPSELRDRLRSAAAESRRSINAEIIARLEATFPDPDREARRRYEMLQIQREDAARALENFRSRLELLEKEIEELKPKP